MKQRTLLAATLFFSVAMLATVGCHRNHPYPPPEQPVQQVPPPDHQHDRDHQPPPPDRDHQPPPPDHDRTAPPPPDRH